MNRCCLLRFCIFLMILVSVWLVSDSVWILFDLFLYCSFSVVFFIVLWCLCSVVVLKFWLVVV